MREQNALRVEVGLHERRNAKDDVDNVGAGRAAKGAIPTTSTKKTKPSKRGGFFFLIDCAYRLKRGKNKNKRGLRFGSSRCVF